jgi:sigma-E factor negative regulatory protein RseB
VNNIFSYQHLLRFVQACLCLLLSGFVSAADVAPEALLDRMSHSLRELNYRGIFSFQRGDKMESLRISHAVIDGKEFERLVYMDGDKREIIRRGHNLDCVHPGHQLIRLDHQGRSLNFGFGKKTEIAKYYQITSKDPGRVAGRSVINLELNPRDTHRFSYRLSLDEESGLLLRTELVGGENKVLERFQFVDITIGEEMLESDFPDAGSSYHADHIEPMLVSSPSNKLSEGWKLKWLPAGFASVVSNQGVFTDEVVTFTDGFSGFSVFFEKDIGASQIKKGLDGHAQRGATTAYSKALLLDGRSYRITVVGEIPVHTAEKLAQSISLVEQVVGQ